jgi:hypothetical protein
MLYIRVCMFIVRAVPVILGGGFRGITNLRQRSLGAQMLRVPQVLLIARLAGILADYHQGGCIPLRWFVHCRREGTCRFRPFWSMVRLGSLSVRPCWMRRLRSVPSSLLGLWFSPLAKKKEKLVCLPKSSSIRRRKISMSAEIPISLF